MPYDLSRARKAIMAECNQQGIDADTRHQIMREIGKVPSGSTKDMGSAAAMRVLDHLRSKSKAIRQPDNEWAWANRATPERQKFIWKIRRLLMGAGIETGKQVAYAEGIARQMSGINASSGAVAKPLAMCDETELRRIVQAISVHLKRQGGG